MIICKRIVTNFQTIVKWRFFSAHNCCVSSLIMIQVYTHQKSFVWPTTYRYIAYSCRPSCTDEFNSHNQCCVLCFICFAAAHYGNGVARFTKKFWRWKILINFCTFPNSVRKANMQNDDHIKSKNIHSSNQFIFRQTLMFIINFCFWIIGRCSDICCNLCCWFQVHGILFTSSCCSGR